LAKHGLVGPVRLVKQHQQCVAVQRGIRGKNGGFNNAFDLIRFHWCYLVILFHSPAHAADCPVHQSSEDVISGSSSGAAMSSSLNSPSSSTSVRALMWIG